MGKTTIRNKTFYWALIGTFITLYLAVAFVSTIHAISFFQLANSLGLAILLGAAYEVGQSAVLFSILMTENKNRILAWCMMLLLTGLQVSANVYASFKFMDASGSMDWTYWQRAILFGVQADSPEMYKVIISWISGALLPLVALGMTALVADNIRLAKGETLTSLELEPEKKKKKKKKLVDKPINNELREEESVNEIMDEEEIEDPPKLEEEAFELIQEESDLDKNPLDKILEEITEEISEKILPDQTAEPREILEKNTEKLIDPQVSKDIKFAGPANKIKGWHFMNEFVDKDHNIFKKGRLIGHDPSKPPTESKKA